MNLALDRFISTYELVAIVVSFLDKQDMHSFRLTCRNGHAVCQQFLYRDILLSDRWTQDELQDLSKHAGTIRSLKADKQSTSRFYSAVIDVLLNDPTVLPTLSLGNMRLQSDTTAAPAPDQLASPVQLVSILSYNNVLDILCEKLYYPAQLLYTVCLSPRLAFLDFGPIDIKTDLELNLLTRTISSIGTLRSLTLSILTNPSDIERVLVEVVHGCPPLVESLSLCINPFRIDAASPVAEGDSSGSQNNSDELTETVLTLLGPVTERKDPLRRLTDWRLVIESKLIDADIFISLLKYLPELTSMDAPTVNNPNFWISNQITKVAHNIAAHCPKLRNVRKRHVHNDSRCDMPFAIIDHMPPNTLESIECTKLQDSKNYNECIDARLLPHAKSLKGIVINDFMKVSPGTVTTILYGYPELEVFWMSEGIFSRMRPSLASLGMKQWVPVKLQELQLVLAMGASRKAPDPSTLVVPVDNDHANPTWTPFLDSLYRRIGDLRELRILSLQVSSDGRIKFESDENYVRYREKTFPGMMVLEDQAACQRGWLQLLAGLGQLEELHGSFNVDAMLPGFAFGQREADWIVNHWPKLKFIELYTVREGIVVEYSPAVRSLVEKMPGLKVVKTFKGRYIPGYGRQY